MYYCGNYETMQDDDACPCGDGCEQVGYVPEVSA